MFSFLTSRDEDVLLVGKKGSHSFDIPKQNSLKEIRKEYTSQLGCSSTGHRLSEIVHFKRLGSLSLIKMQVQLRGMIIDSIGQGEAFLD